MLCKKLSPEDFCAMWASQPTVQKKRGEKLRQDKNAARLGASFF
jgi:hypothetical protein